MRAGKPRESVIFNPAHLRPEEEVDFCGACHYPIQEVKKGNLQGVRTVLSQPYRLMGSRCWNSADRRSRCGFCHDSHAPLVQETAAYDAKCLACHGRTQAHQRGRISRASPARSASGTARAAICPQ